MRKGDGMDSLVVAMLILIVFAILLEIARRK